MQHLSTLEDLRLDRSCLSIGTFDGVHKGHQEIIRQLVSFAKSNKLPSVVVTFYPHPAIVLNKRNKPFYLTLPKERVKLLEEMGVDYVVTYPFNPQVSQKSSQEFIQDLHQILHFTKLIVGCDFALGRNREGNVERLSDYGREMGYEVLSIDSLKINGEKISSSTIRHFLAEGYVDSASEFLGRDYFIYGEVIVGDGRGRLLGIPTANLDVAVEKAIPKEGVYACRVYLYGEVRYAVTNIGYRPTFIEKANSAHIETHLLDYSANIYGETLKLEFRKRLRAEKKFADKQDLIKQIHNDIKATRKLFACIDSN